MFLGLFGDSGVVDGGFESTGASFYKFIDILQLVLSLEKLKSDSPADMISMVSCDG